MATPYVEVTDAQIDYKSGIGQDVLFQLRDNQKSHEERINEILAQNSASIIDDFLVGVDGGSAGSWVDTNLYDANNVNSMMDVDGSHVARFITASVVGFLSPVKTRCRLRLNQDMALRMEFVVKEPGATAMSNIEFGLQDQSINTPATENNVIGFFKGTTAGKWRFTSAKAGVPTSQDNVGNRATWQTLRIDILRSGGGGTFQATGYIDGAAVGAPITTNLPDTVVLKPFLAAAAPAGTPDLRIDRWLIKWAAVPVTP